MRRPNRDISTPDRRSCSASPGSASKVYFAKTHVTRFFELFHENDEEVGTSSQPFASVLSPSQRRTFSYVLPASRRAEQKALPQTNGGRILIRFKYPKYAVSCRSL